MKRSILLGATLGILATNTVQAIDIENELMPMAYVEVPFEAFGKKKVKPIYGFGVARNEVNVETGLASFINTNKVPYLDFKFSGNEIESIKFNGINTLTKKLVHNADGTKETVTAINWNIVIPVAIVGGVAAYAATKDDSDEENQGDDGFVSPI